LWQLAKRVALIFVIGEVVLFVFLQFVVGAPLLFTLLAMVAGAGGLATVSLYLAFDTIEAEEAMDRAESDRYAREFLDEVHRQGPHPPRPPGDRPPP